jgi:hypothetical protein
MKSRLDLVAIAALTLVALLSVGVLAVLQLPVPDVLPLVITAGLGALGMSASPMTRQPAETPALSEREQQLVALHAIRAGLVVDGTQPVTPTS